jgi:predicted PurR-regulated permease PerM
MRSEPAPEPRGTPHGAPASATTPAPAAAPAGAPASAVHVPGAPGAAHRHPERRARDVGWRSRDVLRAAALVMAIYLGLQLLWFANSLVFVVFLGVLFGLAVGAAVDRLERVRIRRGVGAALVVFGTIGALVFTGTLIAPTLGEQIRVLRGQLPAAADRLEDWMNTHRSGLVGLVVNNLVGEPGTAPNASHAPSTTTPSATPTAPPSAAPTPPASAPPQGTAPSATASLRARLGEQLSGATRFLFPFLSSTAAVLGGVLLIIFLAIYIGAEPQLYHDGLMHLFPHRARPRAGEVLTEIATVLRKWLVTQLIAMLAIGLVTTVAMLVLRVKAAFALGVIAALLEFIPTVGPVLSAIPAIAMGLVDSPEKALTVLLAYWGIQFIENHLLIPFLMRGGMDLPPALTLVAQALMTLVFGFLGLMVAVPLTAAVMVPIKMLYVQDVVGDDLSVTTDVNEDEGA